MAPSRHGRSATQTEVRGWLDRRARWQARLLELENRAGIPAALAAREHRLPRLPAAVPVMRARGARRAIALVHRAGVAGLALALLAAGVFLLSVRTATTPVPLDLALDRFRGSGTPAGPVAGEDVPTTVPRLLARAASPVPGTARAAKQVPTVAPFVRPPEGVYTYASEGGESLSLGGARHDYPPETFATVRDGRGCRWEIEHRIVEEHVDHRRMCSGAGEVSLLSHTVVVTFFGQRNRSEWTCDPPVVMARTGDREGTARTFRCRSDDGTSVDRVTLLGRDAVRVGGRTVRALHLLSEADISGRAEGTARAEVWLDPVTGLSLRTIRNIETRTQAFGTTVTYREDATFTLTSLVPRS